MPHRSIDSRYWALVVVAGATTALALALLVRPDHPLDIGHAVGALAIFMTIAGFLLRQFTMIFARFRLAHNFDVKNLLCKVKQRYCIEQRKHAIVCCKEFIDNFPPA